MMAPKLYKIADERFRDLILSNVELKQISNGHLWTEGPVWFADHQCLLFSDIPNQTICRWSKNEGVTVFRAPSDFANGHTRDLQGRLVSCQHGTRSLTRTEHDGTITALATHYDGKRLNSPNDVVVKSDGTIWFTDPTYGILTDYEGYKAEPEQKNNHVFRLDPDGSLHAVATDFVQPNGLAFSPDEKLLYVAESGRSHDDTVPPVIRAFEVDAQNALKNGRDFIQLDTGIPDGFRVDIEGNIWTSASDGVHCFGPCGTLFGKIYLPEVVSNLTFGGERGNQLFITATSGVYSIFVNTKAAVAPAQ